MAEDKTTPGGANKYSVYAQRSVDSTQINWNEISGQLVKGLETIRDERQSRKDAIEKSTQDAIEQLSQVPETGTQDAASLLINGSAMSIKSVQEQNDLMKRGLISPKDNMLFMQQQKNGYKSLSTAVKGWDAWAVEARTRLSDPNISSGNLETFTNLQTEALGNLKNKKLWTNPTNGKMQLVTMGYNKTTKLYDVMPDYETRKQDYQNPNTMLNFMKFQNAGVDVNELAKKQTANIAQIVTATREKLTALGGGGGVNSEEDFRQLGEFGNDEDGNKITYDMWKTDNIDAMVGDITDTSNFNAAEMLTNTGYEFAQTLSQFKEEFPNKDESKWIEVDMSSGQPVPTMKPAQMKQARKLADVAIEAQVSHLVKMTEGKGAKEKQQPTNAANAANTRNTQLIGYMDDTNALASDDESTFEATANDRIIALNGNITNPDEKIDSIKRNNKQIVFELANGAKVPIERLNEDGTPREIRDVVKDMYRLVAPTSEKESYKEAALLYEQEPGGGFRESDRLLNDAEKIVYVAEEKAIAVLKNKKITPTIEDPENPEKQITNPNYEKELKKEIIEQAKGVSQDEKDLVKKRILKNITGEKYQALPPLPRIVQPTKGIVTVPNPNAAAGGYINITGTKVIDNAIGGRLDGLDDLSVGGDDAAEVNKALSDVMNGYLPKELEGGAKVEFSKDEREKIKDPNDETLEIDNPNKGEWSLSVSYFDRSGTQQTLPIQYPDVGSIIPGTGGATPSELNTMIHEAAEKIGTEESERLVNRNQRGTGKNQRKFNG